MRVTTKMPRKLSKVTADDDIVRDVNITQRAGHNSSNNNGNGSNMQLQQKNQDCFFVRAPDS